MCIRDSAKSGIEVKYRITEVSYYDFLSEYELIHNDDTTATTAAEALIAMDTEDFDEMVEEMKVSTAFRILYDVYQPRL